MPGHVPQADITCDSDGVLNHFISTREAVDFDPILPLHELRGREPYHLAMFLTGASADGHFKIRFCSSSALRPASD